MCCFLTGTFVLYMAGVFSSCTNASLFIAMTDFSLLRCIFRQDPDPFDNFYIHGFLFEFAGADDDEDIFYYDISCEDFRMTFVFYGIDTTANCDTSSNLDFVRFIWLNYESFNFVKYSMTFVCRDYPSLPELLCLKYYRALSDGWTDNVHCGSCVTRYQNRLGHMTRCLRPNDCSCTICRRHPPSLLASASNTLFQLVLELDQFVLTSETTYSQYVQAVSSRRVPTQRLFPPNFPVIRLRFRCDVFSHKLHHHCQGNGTGEVEMKWTFRSNIETIRYLAVLENLFWFRYCKRGLFYYPICLRHPIF